MIIKGILDFILLFGISIGLFISSTLLFIKKQNTKANKILASILIIAVIMLLGRLFFMRYYKIGLLFRIGSTLDITIFIFGPLVFYFLKTLLFKSSQIKKNELLYFIPALLYSVFAIWTFTIDNQTYFIKVSSGEFYNFYFFIEFLGIFTNCFFVFKSYNLIKKYDTSATKELSYNQNIISFSKYFLAAYSFSIISWIVGFISFYIVGYYSKIFNYDIVWISIPIFIYLVGFYVLIKPEIFRINTQLDEKKSSKSRLSKQKIETLKIAINKLLKEDKIYHQSNLSLSDLAKKLTISNNDLSWLINNVYNTNFYEFINTYRIEEFIKRVKKGEYQKHTITAVSLDVGFNSKSTFYKAFKLITNTTPKNYIKNLTLKS
jgi:AraC-like DNA-binding protein